MYIYIDKSERNSLEIITMLKNRNYYGMRINGKYGGGFYAPTDTKALEIFKRTLAEAKNNEKM